MIFMILEIRRARLASDSKDREPNARLKSWNWQTEKGTAEGEKVPVKANEDIQRAEVKKKKRENYVEWVAWKLSTTHSIDMGVETVNEWVNILARLFCFKS